MVEHYKELLYYIKKNVSDSELAKDILHETYEKVILVEKEKVIKDKRAFLYKVAKNIIIDKVREKSKTKEIPYEENEFTVKTSQPDEIVIEQDRKKLLMSELNKLPKMRKEVFVLHIFEGYTRKEVSELLGISLVAVEKHISRASIELKEKIRRKES